MSGKKAAAVVVAPLKTANVDPVHARVISEFRAARKPQTLSEYYRSWSERVKAMDSEADAPPRIDPSEIGCTLGPAMTEEQFKQYRSSSGPRVADMYNAYHELKRQTP